MQQTKEQKVKPMFLKARIVNERDGFILADMIVMIVTSLVTFEWPLAQVGSMAQATRRWGQCEGPRPLQCSVQQWKFAR